MPLWSNSLASDLIVVKVSFYCRSIRIQLKIHRRDNRVFLQRLCLLMCAKLLFSQIQFKIHTHTHTHTPHPPIHTHPTHTHTNILEKYVWSQKNVVDISQVVSQLLSYYRNSWVLSWCTMFCLAEFHLSCKKWLPIFKYKKKNSKIPSESEKIVNFG